MSDRVCEPYFADLGWAHRTPALIDRDRRRYALTIGVVATGSGAKGAAEIPVLLHDRLLEAIADSNLATARSAAFVAGRCTTGDDDDDDATVAALDDVIATFDPTDLRHMAAVYVEALMSQALLGDAESARTALTVLVTDPRCDSIAGSLAAAYLAQLGSAAGYPILHTDLHDPDDAHARTMAVRYLVDFATFNGETVGDLTIDVEAEFLARTEDTNVRLASEVPELMAEAGLPGLAGVLADIAASAAAPEVRDAAQWVLDRTE